MPIISIRKHPRNPELYRITKVWFFLHRDIVSCHTRKGETSPKGRFRLWMICILHFLWRRHAIPSFSPTSCAGNEYFSPRMLTLSRKRCLPPVLFHETQLVLMRKLKKKSCGRTLVEYNFIWKKRVARVCGPSKEIEKQKCGQKKLLQEESSGRGNKGKKFSVHDH